MKLYRYASGVSRGGKSRLSLFTVYFRNPDDIPEDEYPVIASSTYFKHRQIDLHYLPESGGAWVLITELEKLGWSRVDQPPPNLYAHTELAADTNPAKAGWYVTEAPDDFLKDVQTIISRMPEGARYQRDPEPVPWNRMRWQVALIGVLSILVLLGLIYRLWP